MKHIASEILDSCMSLSTVDAVLSVNQEPQILQRHGRRYSYIFLSQPVRLFVDYDDDVHSLDFVAGWNPFGVPDGSKISAQEEISILHRAMDQPLTF
jgi:hypothetical protein